MRPVSDEELELLRRRMVDQHIQARGIRDARVLEAFYKIKRHDFVLPDFLLEAYSDSPLPIGGNQTISQPYVVALMIELARLSPKSKVLEIGTGSGYQTAILAELASQVFTIEIVASLAEMAKQRIAELGYDNVRVRIADGYQGWPEEAPFDAIIVTAAPDHPPDPLLQQLKQGGRLIIPIGDYYQELEVITRIDAEPRRQRVIPVRFVPMTGEAEKK